MKEVFHCLTPLSPKRNDEMLRQGNYGSDPKPTPPFDKSVKKKFGVLGFEI